MRTVRKFLNRSNGFLYRFSLINHISRKTEELIDDIELLQYVEDYVRMIRKNQNPRREQHYIGPTTVDGHVQNIFKFWHEWCDLRDDIFYLLGIMEWPENYSDLMHIVWDNPSLKELGDMLDHYGTEWTFTRLLKMDSNIFNTCQYYMVALHI